MDKFWVLAILILGAWGCGQGETCRSNGSRYCTEGILYQVDSCGEFEKIIETCECGCTGDHADCTPCGTSCQPETCSGHGECDDSSGVALCSCQAGYSGPACNLCAPGYVPDGDECIPDDQTGQCPDEPANPDPADGELAERVTMLRYEGDRNPEAQYDIWDTRYDIYFGNSNPPPLMKADTGADRCHLVSEAGSIPCLEDNPEYELAPGTYFWKVVATSPLGCSSESDTWSFTVTGAPVDEDSCPETPTVIDAQGNVYPTIQIGEQCWMKKSLNIGNMNTQIQFCQSDGQCPGSAECRQGQCTGPLDGSEVQKWCQDNVQQYCDAGCGGMYRWYEIMQGASAPGAQGICPDGWRIPTTGDWDILAGQFESATSLIKYFGSSGFDAILCGKRRDATANYDSIATSAYFWTSNDEFNGDQPATTEAHARVLTRDDPEMGRRLLNKNFAMSVRCIKE